MINLLNAKIEPEIWLCDILLCMNELVYGLSALGISLNSVQLGQFETYYQELVDYNSRINLTAITEYKDVQIKHFLDSVSLVLAGIKGDEKLLDVGSGAGFPGLPLKMLFPAIQLGLLEATQKKARFLSEITVKLGLSGVEIISQRAEDTAQNPLYRQKYSLVTSRAVADMATLAELTLPFCAIGGRVIAPKKGDIEEEMDRAATAVKKMGGRVFKVIKVELPGLEDGRKLVLLEKISNTPALYPRRAGIPAKTPLI
ncbi:16S rRNA methyltransferase G [Dehalococcoides mccartyi]|nr:16S rRNA methyltransferase G [Dehalococcoides mccartyi]